MLQFYKKAALLFVFVVIFSLAAVYLCLANFLLFYELIPAGKSAFKWKVSMESDGDQGGGSYIAINDSAYTLDYEFLKSPEFKNPYASLKFEFITEKGDLRMQDLSRYSRFSFNIRCSPRNILTLLVFTLDEELTKREGKDMIRPARTFFSCEEEWTEVELDMTHLEIPDWWLRANGFELSDKNYSLEKTAGFLLGTSTQTHSDLGSRVKITELAIQGKDWRFVYSLGVFIVLIWCGYVYWYVKQHTRHLIADLKLKLQKDRPLVAYHNLSINSQKDKDKDSILRFMATQYSNPDVSLDTIANELKVDKPRINEILKEELGYTFNSYLNKLRLTEAARLLSEGNNSNVAEIAFCVGYKYVPYFNRLFKNEYGCSPKKFREIYNK